MMMHALALVTTGTAVGKILLERLLLPVPDDEPGEVSKVCDEERTD